MLTNLCLPKCVHYGPKDNLGKAQHYNISLFQYPPHPTHTCTYTHTHYPQLERSESLGDTIGTYLPDRGALQPNLNSLCIALCRKL